MSKKIKKTGFQFPGQIPLEDFDKIKAPRGKFIIVKRSANNITGWGYTKISTHRTKRSLLLAMNRLNRDSNNRALGHESVTMGRAINSIDILGIDSRGNILSTPKEMLEKCFELSDTHRD